MSGRTRLAWSTLGVSLLVLLPFLAHLYLSRSPEYRAPGSPGEIGQLIARGEYARAYALLQRVEEEPLQAEDRALLHVRLAVCERHLDRPERAYARLTRLGNALPLLAEHRRLWMAGALEDMDDTGSAAAAYEDFLLTATHPHLQSEARLQLAGLYATAGECAKALALYARQLQEHPARAPELLGRMAGVEERCGQEAQARHHRLQLIEEHPGSRQALEALAHLSLAADDPALYARASTYFEHEQPRRAMRDAQRFLESHPHHQLAEEAHYLKARALLADGQYERARQSFADIFATYRRPSALYRIAGVLVRLDREDEAIATYEQFARLFPHHDLADEALWQAAKACERHDRFEQAETFYRLLAETYPESRYRDEAGWGIGFTFFCRGEYDKALIVFERLISMAREVHIVDQSLFWAGKTAERLGRAEAAHAYYRQAAGGFPRSYYSARAVALGHAEAPPVRRPPGMALRARPEDAADLAEPDYLYRADLFHQLGLAQLARRELLLAEQLNAGNGAALRVIRDRYEAQGFPDLAMHLSTRLFISGDEREIGHLYPTYYWEQIVEAAGEARVDPYLVISVIRQESSFRQDAVSRAGALGLMQIMPQTGRLLAHSLGLRRFEHRSLLDPEMSIRLGSIFLGDQVRQFAEGPAGSLGYELGLAAYNAGPHNAQAWLKRFPHEDPDAFVERIPYKETRLYVKLVLKNYTIYKALSDV